LLELLGQHVPRSADRGGLRTDAGDVPPLGPDSLRPGASLDLTRTFLEAGAQVVVSVRRIVLHLPHSFPDLDSFQRLAFSLGARSGQLHRRAAPRNFLLVNLLLEVSNFVSRSSLGPSHRTQKLPSVQ